MIAVSLMPLDLVEQRARNIREDQIVTAVLGGPAIIEDADDIGMLQLREGSRLAAEDLLFERVIVLGIQQFDRNRPVAATCILGLVYGAHVPTADPFDQPVAPGDPFGRDAGVQHSFHFLLLR